MPGKDFLYNFTVVTCQVPLPGKFTEPVPNSLDGSLLGTEYTYKCTSPYRPFADYEAAGGMTTTCQETGDWSINPAPSCVGK